MHVGSLSRELLQISNTTKGANLDTWLETVMNSDGNPVYCSITRDIIEL